MLIKYSRPTKYDIEPVGTVWFADMESSQELYIQVLDSNEYGEWIRLGNLLEVAFMKNPGSYKDLIDALIENTNTKDSTPTY